MKRFVLIFLLLTTISFAAEDALRIQNQQTIPAVVQAGDKDVILQFDLYHAGRFTYTNVTIQLNLPQQFEGIKTAYYIERILPGQTTTVTFRFNVEPNVDPGTYTIPITLKYTDASGPYETSSSRQLYLSISSTPTLRFEDILFNPTPHIGEPFILIVKVKDTAQIPASNIIATISSPTAKVTWIPNSQVIDFINANSTEDITFKGLVSSEATPGAYEGTITLTYSGKMASNAFFMEIHGKPDVRLAGSQTDKTPYVGEKFTLSIQLEDVGKEKARSVQVVLKDPALLGTLASYVGTIEPDDTGSAIFDITISKAGSYAVPIEYTYTDDEGNTYTQREEISLFIYTRPFDFTGVILLVIVVFIIWYWQKGRKRKRHIEKIVD
jgi:hypothetical protein